MSLFFCADPLAAVFSSHHHQNVSNLIEHNHYYVESLRISFSDIHLSASSLSFVLLHWTYAVFWCFLGCFCLKQANLFWTGIVGKRSCFSRKFFSNHELYPFGVFIDQTMPTMLASWFANNWRKNILKRKKDTNYKVHSWWKDLVWRILAKSMLGKYFPFEFWWLFLLWSGCWSEPVEPFSKWIWIRADQSSQ